MYLCLPAIAAFDIDTSVDDDIRKKYNTKKIEDDLLPPLPENLKQNKKVKSNEDFSKTTTTTTNKATLKEVKEVKNVPKSQGQQITIKRGTKFTVRLT